MNPDVFALNAALRLLLFTILLISVFDISALTGTPRSANIAKVGSFTRTIPSADTNLKRYISIFGIQLNTPPDMLDASEPHLVSRSPVWYVVSDSQSVMRILSYISALISLSMRMLIQVDA